MYNENQSYCQVLKQLKWQCKYLFWFVGIPFQSLQWCIHFDIKMKYKPNY